MPRISSASPVRPCSEAGTWDYRAASTQNGRGAAGIPRQNIVALSSLSVSSLGATGIQTCSRVGAASVQRRFCETVSPWAHRAPRKISSAQALAAARWRSSRQPLPTARSSAQYTANFSGNLGDRSHSVSISASATVASRKPETTRISPRQPPRSRKKVSRMAKPTSSPVLVITSSRSAGANTLIFRTAAAVRHTATLWGHWRGPAGPRQSFDQGGPLHAEVAAHGRLGHATFERGDNGISFSPVIACGRPPIRPRLRAAARPATTRSWIKARSY